MHREEKQSKNFVVGAILGGLIGTAAALLLAPKSGGDLREDIRDVYDDFKDSINDNLPFQEPKSNSHVGLTISSIAGGLVGVIAAFLLATKQGKKIRKDLKSRFDDLSEDSMKRFMDMKPNFRSHAKRKLAKRK